MRPAVGLAEGLRDSDRADGCPVTATALGTAGRLPDIQRAAGAAFDHRQGLVREELTASGVPGDEAAGLACTIISTLEGAEPAAQVTPVQPPLRLAGTYPARLVALSLPR
ncbi:hypothetical protein ACIQ9E_11115 [Streptomyces sp. NPDC094448]|uniref:LmrA/YxaF family transcription factor n=1 Tax=Streptomyces sp. NPDC094448 TaxID=3366063 RepID=UPI00380AAF28